MKIIKGVFFATIFLVQIALGLIVYVYSAHNYSLGTTIFVAVFETVIAFWAYDRMFKTPEKTKKSIVKKIPKHEGAIVKSIMTRKTIEV